LVVYKKFDEGRSDYPATALSSLTDTKLVGWLKENATPLLDEVSGENYSFYAESGLPLAYIFVDPSTEGKDAFVETFKPLAKSYKGKINFVWIDAIKFGEHAKSMNLQEAKWPAFVVQDVEKQLKWPYDQTKPVTADDVATFVKAYSEGRIDPSLKSQAIPETQDEPTFTLVTKQFDEVVFDNSKDVFVEFYAPWCGHCKRLKPIWDQLGEKYAAIKDKLVIAKMDSTENDTPPSVPFRINGFPTLKFKPAGGREFVDYEGDRSFESLVEFVEKHAKNSLVIPVQESAASTAASSSSPAAETSVAAQETHAQGHVEL
jgi:protein disulfide-isomerase A1